MKTAAQRSQELLTLLGIPWSSDTLHKVERAFKQYAMDQRSICGRRIVQVVSCQDRPFSIYDLVLDAPFPGEE